MRDDNRLDSDDAAIDHTEPSMSLTPGPEADDQQDTEEIRARIEETRAEMSGTIDAIQEKLSPDRLKEHAKEMVREATVGRAEDIVSNAGQTAKGFSYDMLETIKQNPLPAALAAVGIGWLFMKSSNNSSESRGQYFRSEYYRGGPEGSGYDRYGYDRSGYNRSGYDQQQNKVGEIAGQAQQTVGRVASQAGDKVGQLGDQVGDTVGQVGDKVGQFGDQAQYKAGQATDWFQRALLENPLAVGAVGAALGAALGLILPETRPEHQVMGQARDNLMEKAQTAVQDTMQKVQHVAEEATNTVQQEAQNQGLAPQSQGQI